VWRPTISLIICFLFLLCAPTILHAQDSVDDSKTDAGLEEILQGFDDEEGADTQKSQRDQVPDSFDKLEDSNGEDQSLDDVLEGFNEEEEVRKDEALQPEPDELPSHKLSGILSLGVSYAYAHDAPQPGEPDYRGLNRLRPELNIDLESRFSKNWRTFIGGHFFYDFAYAIKGREQFTEAMLDLYESQALLDEAFLQGTLTSDLDLKFGRQIVAWGRSDNIRVVDILNPLDLREPGLVDIEDLRLPVFMTRLDYYFADWNLSGMALHEIRFSFNPVFNAEFFPFNQPLPPEEKPANTLDNTQFGLALNGTFSGWDISFYWARFFQDETHLELIAPGQLVRRHSLLHMVGTGFNIALGNWLLKSEAGYFDGLEFLALPGETKSRFDLMFGIEYSGFSETLISLEMVNRHLIDFDPRLKSPSGSVKENEFQAVLRAQKDFVHDSLHLTFLASMFGPKGDGGAFQRLSVEYDVKDNVSTTIGVVTYQSGDRPFFRNIGDKDRLFFDVRYFF
jgi:hypothetical protein